jgi:hypothetical protein
MRHSAAIYSLVVIRERNNSLSNSEQEPSASKITAQGKKKKQEILDTISAGFQNLDNSPTD